MPNESQQDVSQPNVSGGDLPTRRGAVMRLTGRFDAVEAPAVRAAIGNLVREAATAGGDVTVDLSEVDFLDSAALAALVWGRKQARASGVDLVLVAPRSTEAMRTFELTRFDRVFVFVSGEPDPTREHDGRRE